MSEIALRTTERRLEKAKYLAWRPVGSAIVCCSDHTIRRKWLEICCDLVSPAKRDQYRNIPGWKRLCDAWTPDLREAWLAEDRPVKDYPLGRLLVDHAYSATVWDKLIYPIGVDKDLPLAPESDVPVHRTWLWSSEERKRYFVVVNADAPGPMVDGWNGCDERIDGDRLVVSPRRMVAYKTELSLPAAMLTKIANPDVIVHPRHDTPVVAAKFKQPALSLARKGGPD